MPNPILQSIEPVVKNSQHVKIHFDAVSKYAETIDLPKESEIGFGPFDISIFPEKDQLHFLLILCITNFCYWGEPKWSPKMGDKELGGQWGNIFCLIRALQKGTHITSPEYLLTMTRQNCLDLYQANCEIPLVDERLEALHQIGRGLKQYNNDFGNFIAASKGDLWDFLDRLASTFPSFDDSYNLNGKKIIFHKKAQLLVAFLQHFFPKTHGNFHNADLTAFADYKQPIVLDRLGLIDIDPTLKQRLVAKEELVEGSREEIELRMVQVWICELIRRQLAQRAPHITAPAVSTHFWLLAKEKIPGDIPHHRTLTVRY